MTTLAQRGDVLYVQPSEAYLSPDGPPPGDDGDPPAWTNFSGSSAGVASYGKSSAATSLAGGTAAILRNAMRGTGTLEPGFVYAAMIAGGSKALTPGVHFDNIEGAGKLSAALWWPNGYSNTHSDVDLQLIDPNGTVRAQSQDISTSYELTRITGPIQAGTWKLRVFGFKIGEFNLQKVYASASICR